MELNKDTEYGFENSHLAPIPKKDMDSTQVSRNKEPFDEQLNNIIKQLEDECDEIDAIPSGKSAILWAYGPTASIFYGIWIIQSGPMVFIFNLDNISLKQLFPTMNI